jgi:hypothetical protein
MIKNTIGKFEKSAYYHHLHYAKEHIELLPKEKQKVFKGMGGIDTLCELTRIRDNHTCQICGEKWIFGTRRFDVHHLDSDIETKKDKTIEDYKGVETITLCHKCHLNLEYIRNRMSKSKTLLTF